MKKIEIHLLMIALLASTSVLTGCPSDPGVEPGTDSGCNTLTDAGCKEPEPPQCDGLPPEECDPDGPDTPPGPDGGLPECEDWTADKWAPFFTTLNRNAGQSATAHWTVGPYTGDDTQAFVNGTQLASIYLVDLPSSVEFISENESCAGLDLKLNYGDTDAFQYTTPEQTNRTTTLEFVPVNRVTDAPLWIYHWVPGGENVLYASYSSGLLTENCAADLKIEVAMLAHPDGSVEIRRAAMVRDAASVQCVSDVMVDVDNDVHIDGTSLEIQFYKELWVMSDGLRLGPIPADAFVGFVGSVIGYE